MAAAVIFFLSGLWLALRLPGWEAALGVARLSDGRKALVDVSRLRKTLAAVFLAFSAVFLAFLLCLAFRALSQKTSLAFCFLALALFLDVVIIPYRRFDSAERPELPQRAGLICALCVNIILAGLSFILLAL